MMWTRTASQTLSQGAALALLLLLLAAALPAAQSSGRHLQQQPSSGTPTAGGAPATSLQRFLNGVLAQLSGRPTAGGPSPQASVPTTASSPVPSAAAPALPGLGSSPEAQPQPQRQEATPPAPTVATNASDAANSTGDAGGPAPALGAPGIPAAARPPPSALSSLEQRASQRIIVLFNQSVPAAALAAQTNSVLAALRAHPQLGPLGSYSRAMRLGGQQQGPIKGTVLRLPAAAAPLVDSVLLPFLRGLPDVVMAQRDGVVLVPQAMDSLPARVHRTVGPGELTPVGVSRIGANAGASCPPLAPRPVYPESDCSAPARPFVPTPGVMIGVLDTGCQAAHPDLLNVCTEGESFASDAAGNPLPWYEDEYGHGTHVAGIMAAKYQGEGIFGVAPGTRVYTVRIMDETGAGLWSWVLSGVAHLAAVARQKGIRVVNMSMGASDRNLLCRFDVLCWALRSAARQGVLFVVAAGNGCTDLSTSLPACCGATLAVTAAYTRYAPRPNDAPTGLDHPAWFSNYCTWPADCARTLAAPGVNILSTVPAGQAWVSLNGAAAPGYAYKEGTSMAAPHVAAVAARCVMANMAPGAAASNASLPAACTPAGLVAAMRAYAAANPGAGLNGSWVRDPAGDVAPRPWPWARYGTMVTGTLW